MAKTIKAQEETPRQGIKRERSISKKEGDRF
jgi:hypothetical protein